MIRYLSLEQVEEIHRVMIQRFGGLGGIRDENLLMSALEAPKASFAGCELYPSILEKAAVYLYHLVKNHPFTDGNKRTAYFVTLLFLEANGIDCRFEKTDLEDVVVRTAAGMLSKEQLVVFLETGKMSMPKQQAESTV